jgi:hypothetical protein
LDCFGRQLNRSVARIEKPWAAQWETKLGAQRNHTGNEVLLLTQDRRALKIDEEEKSNPGSEQRGIRENRRRLLLETPGAKTRLAGSTSGRQENKTQIENECGGIKISRENSSCKIWTKVLPAGKQMSKTQNGILGVDLVQKPDRRKRK